jgi:hypothetical protein
MNRNGKAVGRTITPFRFFRHEKVLDSQTGKEGELPRNNTAVFSRVVLKCLPEQGIGGCRRSPGAPLYSPAYTME